MEPLALAASILVLSSLGRKILSPFANSKALGDELPDELLVFQVHLGILEEISQITLVLRSELPSTMKSCTQLCQRRLERVQKLVLEYHEHVDKRASRRKLTRLTNSEEALVRPIAEFSSSVQLLRELVTEYALWLLKPHSSTVR